MNATDERKAVPARRPAGQLQREVLARAAIIAGRGDYPSAKRISAELGVPLGSVDQAVRKIKSKGRWPHHSRPASGGRPPTSATDGLTPRQEFILGLIRRSIVDNGYPPTIREIGDAVGIRSANGVMCHLWALEQKGHIRRAPDLSRGIIVLSGPSGDCCPHCGRPMPGPEHPGGDE